MTEIHSIYRSRVGIEQAPVSDGYVLYHTAADMVHYLNPTAAVIFELCDGQTTLEEIAAILQESYGLPSSPLSDVRACITQLVEQQLVEPWTKSLSAA